MTDEELISRYTFRMAHHVSFDTEHCTVYKSIGGKIAFCDHVPVDEHGNPRGRAYRHYMIDGKVYKTRKKFLEALKEYETKHDTKD